MADTWWFGLTSRLPAARLIELARRRVDQGFSAAQIVVGIPPEVGPLNENARSDVGFPWTLAGEFNHDYLSLARERITLLNRLGLKVIVYGGWGHQIAWLGTQGMAQWWSNLVTALDDLDVAYCLTGESNIWPGMEDCLLPDRTTANLSMRRPLGWLPNTIRNPLKQLARRIGLYPRPSLNPVRRAAWGEVLRQLASQTQRPILIHTLPGETGVTAVDNGYLLAANTIQTGHSESTRNELWQIPLRERQQNPLLPFLNLEPWYEGILGRFGQADQLYAYWVTMMAGTDGYCYGAHGIWNVGDGSFLAHWGGQTFDDALSLDTPRLIGLSHRLLMGLDPYGQATAESRGDQLLWLERATSKGGHVRYYPDISAVREVPSGRYWLPLTGEYTTTSPRSGPVVCLFG